MALGARNRHAHGAASYERARLQSYRGFMPTAEPRIAIPLRSRAANQRIAERFGAELPITVGGEESVTHDLSTHGLSFEAERPYAPGDRITVTIDYLLDGHHYPMRCEAIVARCERQGARFVIGASLVEPLAEPGVANPLP